MVIHTIEAGDTLASIGREYGVDPVRLAAENGFSPQQTLAVGQTVVIQFPQVVYAVQPADSLFSIARRFSVSVNALYRNNRWLMGNSSISPGQTLVIEYDRQSLGTFSVGGYAYPSIPRALLASVCPYLTHLMPFTYGISATGDLIAPEDVWMIDLALTYRAASLLHLSTVTEDGTFSNGRASMVLNDEALRQKLCNEVLETIREKSYRGVDIDFEYVFPGEREQYAALISQLRQTLNPYGYPVVAALAPKTSAAQRGLLYEAHDYALIGRAANGVFLMTYEWGYTYGPPMAVAPLPNVKAVLDYALTEIPAEKISLGIPNYGYDWTLPFRQGSSRAQSLSNEAAVALAVRYGAEIQYDETARAPWFGYRDESGNAHEVWFEDARSIEAKLRLAAENGLRGVGYWNLDRPFAQNWLVVNAFFEVQIDL